MEEPTNALWVWLTIPLIFALFAVFFIALWSFVIFLVAMIGGWPRLAQYYRAQADFDGTRWSMQSGYVGLSRYRGVLTVGANWQGLYLAVFPLFRIAHPALFIPWSDISTAERQGFLFIYLDFHFAQTPGVRLSVHKNLGEKILAARSGL